MDAVCVVLENILGLLCIFLRKHPLGLRPHHLEVFSLSLTTFLYTKRKDNLSYAGGTCAAFIAT